MKYLKTNSLVFATGFFASGISCFSAVLVDDGFDDGALGTNSLGVGTGFSSANSSSSGWAESGTGVTHTGGTTNGAPTARLYSNDSFVANSTLPSGQIEATFVLSDWSREVGSTNFNSRFAIGITTPTTAHVGTAPNSLDGLWLLMSFDGNGLSVGEGGLSYVDGGSGTAIGTSWDWDDNGVSVAGATAVDIEDLGSTTREDRVNIDMNASDIAITIGLGADFWSLDFSSSDPSVVLPASQSGSFSALGLSNDLSDAIVSIYHQGDGDHTATFDQISVSTVPEPSVALLGLLSVGLAFSRRRK